jgi:hypothetical protein
VVKKQNLNLTDEYGNKLTLYRPSKKGTDETLHLEVVNEGMTSFETVACMNLDFIAASELADALVRFSRKLRIEPLEDPEEPDRAIHTGTDCWCIADKVEPAPYSWQEPWGKDWFNAPNTVTQPPDMKYTVWNTALSSRDFTPKKKG